MNMLGCAVVVLVAALAAPATATCPDNMELINQKCYLFGTASSRDDALAQCQAADANNHLWIINHQLEMDQVMEYFSKRLISPWAWTDGVRKAHDSTNHWIWETTGARISYSPDSAEGEVCDGTCVSDDCATAPMGDCVALSFNDVGVRSYQGCSCEEPDINFICESADEAPFDCPDDVIFNPDVGYCDFPENNPNCA